MGLRNAWNRVELSLQRELGTTSPRIRALEQENLQLRAEIERLKKKPRLTLIGVIESVRRTHVDGHPEDDWVYYDARVTRKTGIVAGTRLYAILNEDSK
jgi:hypothetical protein